MNDPGDFYERKLWGFEYNAKEYFFKELNLKEDLLNIFEQVLGVEYTTIPKTSASYCYEMRSGTLYIFFEHSNGTVDWRNNFDFPSKPYRKMENRWYVHRGFLRVWKSARERLKGKICNKSVRSIVIAGYSHGAALALLCHEFCVYHRPDIAENIYGYGFGCPRVVHGYLKRKICERFKNFFVIRNCKDIVTHLPPAFFGFRHVGNIIHIGKNANYGPVNSHRAANYIEQLMIMRELPQKERPPVKRLSCKVQRS